MATIQPNDTDMANTGTLPFSSIPDLDPPLTLKKSTTERKPRIDVEPLYSAVKGAISDVDWTTYKASLTQFLLGNLNQEELSFKLGKILNTTALEHAHNSLVAAMYANIWRDAPEAGIASWVSSTDKPSSSTVKGQGDESEKRLKYEVMQLSRRERKRLKGIPAAEAAAVGGQDAPGAGSGATGPVNELIEMKRGKQPAVGPVGPAGGYKTSKFASSAVFWKTSAVKWLVKALGADMSDRLGSRDRKTIHCSALQRNTRVSYRILDIYAPPAIMLRRRSAAGPYT
jgi:transcriptional coactivator HFI1/ADA1